MARLVKKTMIPYEGKVYDLTVSNSHTYNVECKAVHNSAGGSLLAYVLNITQMDPIRFGLLFERFLVRKKKGYPDIDSDFSDRDRAVKLLINYFGRENVIPVSNFVQSQLSSLIKDVARLYDLPFEEVNAITPLVRMEVLAVKKNEEGFDMGTFNLTFEDAVLHSPTFNKFLAEHPEFESTIQILFKQMKGLSRHAGGVVITSNASEGMPLILNGGELQTPWPEGVNYRHLEEFGLLKFDILGLGTLRVFENCIRKILMKEGVKHPTFLQVKEWFHKNLHPDNNALDDQKVFETVFHGHKYIGIFQFVQDNTQQFMADMKPRSVLDIAIATSIFRPGPLSLKINTKYLANRANPDNVTYKHPLLREVYEETSGLLIFQEQLQMIYHKLAGIPLDETDSVRKAFTKKEISNKEKAAKDREKLKLDFCSLCQKNNGISPNISESIFDEMEKLVAYSFNKSHAMAYAITSYQAAWFLTYYPEEWITSYIDYSTIDKGKVSGKADPKTVAIKEAKALGYDVGKADINLSDYEFSVNQSNRKELIPGFASIKYVGKTAMEEIKSFAPYKTPLDLLIGPDGKWRHSDFNKRALSTLIRLEAFDSMDIVGEGKTFKHYAEMHAVLIDNLDKLKRVAARKKDNDVAEHFKNILAEVRALKMPDWTRQEKIAFQKELAGSIDFDLLISPKVMEELGILGYESIDNWTEKGNYWGIVSSGTVSTTKTGKKFLKLKLYAEESKETNCFVWNWKDSNKLNLVDGDVVIGVFDKSDFGLSTFDGKIFKLTQ